MVDVFPRETRSRVMSMIRSRWTKQERMLHGFLKGWRIRHTMHPALPGQPDIFVPPRTLVFVDGCFWHGCPRCYNTPKSNIRYWKRKVESNRARDRKVNAALRRRGWLVIRVWECELKKAPSKFLGRIMRALQRRRTGATARHPLA